MPVALRPLRVDRCTLPYLGVREATRANAEQATRRLSGTWGWPPYCITEDVTVADLRIHQLPVGEGYGRLAWVWSDSIFG